MSGWKIVEEENIEAKCDKCQKTVSMRVIIEVKENAIRRSPVCMNCGYKGVNRIRILKE